MIFSRRAQTMMEYILLLSIIVAAVALMLPRVKRTSQSMMKSVADQIGDQAGADQTFNKIEQGFLVNSTTSSKATVNNLRTEKFGFIDQYYNETSDTTTTSFTNSGWSEE